MRRVFNVNRSTTKMPPECAAVGCAELQTKRSLFSFHTFPKGSSRRKLHPWRFELDFFPSRLPWGHPHRHELFTKGIGHASPGFARLIFGRWKERPLRMKPPSLPILQGIYPDRPKDSEIHFDTLAPSAKIKIKQGETKKLLHKKPSRKRKGNQQKRQMYTQILSKNELVINADEEGGEEEGRKRKEPKNKWTW